MLARVIFTSRQSRRLSLKFLKCVCESVLYDGVDKKLFIACPSDTVSSVLSTALCEGFIPEIKLETGINTFKPKTAAHLYKNRKASE